ncbi:hypothetical protein BJ741DRAFT_608558 [Chytriomyces cf. hyalinus JEL632]|nr:hypothetical protein BJ741DRAFT_608558 [Chytriomyces cf. hyalinus JEL632]
MSSPIDIPHHSHALSRRRGSDSNNSNTSCQSLSFSEEHSLNSRSFSLTHSRKSSLCRDTLPLSTSPPSPASLTACSFSHNAALPRTRTNTATANQHRNLSAAQSARDHRHFQQYLRYQSQLQLYQQSNPETKKPDSRECYISEKSVGLLYYERDSEADIPVSVLDQKKLGAGVVPRLRKLSLF